MFRAICHNDISALEVAVKKYGINIFDNFEEDEIIDASKGETPLIHAVLWEKLDLVKWLIENGANKYITNIFDDTAFHLAAKKGYLDIVKFFLILA